MILDKLLEKKDLEAYLRLRADFLKSEMNSEILKLKPEDREFIRERFKGRISELEHTINTIKQDTLKRDSKWCYKQLHKNDSKTDNLLEICLGCMHPIEHCTGQYLLCKKIMYKKCWECDINEHLKWNSERCDNCMLINNVQVVRTVYNGGLPPQFQFK